MSYQIRINRCFQTWFNFIHSVDPEGKLDKNFAISINEALQQYNCVYLDGYGILTFESEEDYSVFKLRWS